MPTLEAVQELACRYPVPDGSPVADAVVAYSSTGDLRAALDEALQVPAQTVVKGSPEWERRRFARQVERSVNRLSRRRRMAIAVMSGVAGGLLGLAIFNGFHVENHLKHLTGQEKIEEGDGRGNPETNMIAMTALFGLTGGWTAGVFGRGRIAHRVAAEHFDGAARSATSWTLPAADSGGRIVIAIGSGEPDRLTDYRLASGEVLGGTPGVALQDVADLAALPDAGTVAIADAHVPDLAPVFSRFLARLDS